MNKQEALAKEWNKAVEDVTDKGGNIYSIGNMEFLVLTNEEANKLYFEKAKDGLKKEGIYALPWDFREYLKDNVLDEDKLEELELKLTKKGLLNIYKEDFEEYKQMLINGGYIDEDDTYTKEELKGFINEMGEDMVNNDYESPADTLENEFGEEDFWHLIVKAGLITYNKALEELRNWDDLDRGEILAEYDQYEDSINETPYYFYRLK